MTVLFYPVSVFLGFVSVLISAVVIPGRMFAGKRRKICEFRAHDTVTASIIILNYNGKHLLETCMPSVIKAVEYDGSGHEVILADNGSDDGSIDYVRENFPSVRILALSRNLYYSGANNIAAKYAKNDIVIFLNNDMIVEEDFIRPLLDHFRGEDVFAVSSRIRMEPRKEGGYLVNETGCTRGRFIKGFLEIWQEEPRSGEPGEIFYFSGGSSAVSREKFLCLGGFDTLFNPFYYEDTDLSMRAKENGWKIIYEPRSVVHHKFRGTNNEDNFPAYMIKLAVKTNYILINWKNTGDPVLLAEHFLNLALRLFSTVPGKSDPGFAAGFVMAVLKLPRLFARSTV
ncbi:MAG: glycosyltransferase family 2 protein [Elusimicrobia bacterium]|nr:glycosyltransferase family 2 protein [Elusimicrobiota bacterium]